MILLSVLFILLSPPLWADDTFTEPVTAGGEVLIFGGRTLDRQGRPIPNLFVEIWQTDEQGIYHHPRDSKTRRRDRNFQFFGTSVTDGNGSYRFRTVLPGKYEPRPRHIHVKIRRSGQVLLVTQIYFSADGDTIGVGGSNGNLKMEVDRVIDSDDSVFYSGEFDFIVDVGVSGSLPLTDSQSEGPYYPREDVSQYDNDLANVNN